MLLILLTTLFLAAAGIALWSARISKPLFNDRRQALSALPALAPRSEALTFAHAGDRLLLVTAVREGGIEAIDLTALYGPERTGSPLALYRDLGFDSLSQLTAPLTDRAFDALGLPLSLGDHHVAAGTNYSEHAEEVMLEDPPFLFPKLAAPTRWDGDVPFTRRLDFEAELGLVPLEPILSADATYPEFAGLLTNDFSDRWTLVRQLKLRKPMGTTGFAAAKGQPGYLPAGYFLLIPRDPAFMDRIEIRLYVNDRLRQRFLTGDMLLKGTDIVRQSFTDNAQAYFYGKEPVSLLPGDGLTPETLLLTGTAGGVIFKPANIWNQRLYLQPGDVIRTEASYLGVLENMVTR